MDWRAAQRDLVGMVVSASITVGIYAVPLGLGLIMRSPLAGFELEERAPYPSAQVYWEGVPSAGEDVEDAPDEAPEELLEAGPEAPVTEKVAVAPKAAAAPAEQDVEGVAGVDVPTPDSTTGVMRARIARRVSSAVGGVAGVAVQNAAGRSRRTPRAATKRCVKEIPEIRTLGEQRFEIDQELVRYYSGSIKAFNSLGWSRANEDRDVKGWYISGFGCDDVLYHAGLRRGDVVRTINGKRTNSMLQVFWLYQSMKSRKHFEVEVLRKGEPVLLQYEIAEPS